MKNFFLSLYRELAAEKHVAIPLPPRVCIQVTGADAIRYLNGQLTNQMERLEEITALRACLLTVKGKLVAAPYCWKSPDGCIVMEEDISREEAILARLERYIVADDVELSLARAPEVWHLVGPTLPEMPEGREVARMGLPGLDLSTESLQKVESNLPGLVRLTTTESEWFRIARGVPTWEHELSEDVFPAEVGLDRTAVDFHKGCYLGQEVVSRLQSVGRARRGLVHWTAKPGCCPLPQASLVQPGGDRAVGRVTSVADVGPEKKSYGLALLRMDQFEKGGILHASQEGNPPVEITVHTIP